jgi:hypothetical protein
VTGFDIADKAMAAANEQAAKLGVKIRTEVNTIEAFDYGENRWDLILLSYAGAGPSADRSTGQPFDGGDFRSVVRHRK